MGKLKQPKKKIDSSDKNKQSTKVRKLYKFKIVTREELDRDRLDAYSYLF